MRSYFEYFVKYVFIISKSRYNILLVNAFVIVFIINCEHRLLVLLVGVPFKFFKNNLNPTNALRLEEHRRKHTQVQDFIIKNIGHAF